MSATTSEQFFLLARTCARVQSRKLGLVGDDAEECEQRFVVKWLFKAYDPPLWTLERTRLEALLRSAARNHAINFRLAVAASSQASDGIGPAAICTARIGGTDANLMRELFWDKVGYGMESLTGRQKALLIRYHVRDERVREIADATGCSADAVRHQLARVHRRLAAALISHGDTEAELYSCLATDRADEGPDDSRGENLP